MSSPAAEYRKEVSDTIYNALSSPSEYGDGIFTSMVRNAGEGYMPLVLLKTMLTDLNDIPVGYLCHAIEKQHPSLLQLNEDRTKVRITRDGPKIAWPQTDPYGVQLDPACRTKSSSPVESTASEDESSAQTRSQFFKPFKARFASCIPKEATDGSPSDPSAASLNLILYADGLFYLDKLTAIDGGAIQQPKFEIQTKSLSKCWNCDKPGHSLTECEEPRNHERVRINRALMMLAKAKDQPLRFYDQILLNEQVAKMKPGHLSKNLCRALGCEHGEPPYYNNMRHHGYPPGYLGASPDENPLHDRRQRKRQHRAGRDACNENSDNTLIQVYDDYRETDTHHTDSSLDNDPPATPTGDHRQYKLVEYPGLNWPDTPLTHMSLSLCNTELGTDPFHRDRVLPPPSTSLPPPPLGQYHTHHLSAAAPSVPPTTQPDTYDGLFEEEEMEVSDGDSS